MYSRGYHRSVVVQTAKIKWQNQNRKLHKSLGVCVDCDTPAMVGYTRCFRHWWQQRYYNGDYYQRNREAKIQENIDRQHRLVEDGKCRSCGRPREEEGTSVYCYACACYALERR